MSVRFFMTSLLPIGLGHIGVLLLMTIWLKLRARWACIFWGVSWTALLLAGGLSRAGTGVFLLAFAVVLVCMGDTLAQFLLGKDCQSWGVSLAFGILLLSVVGAFLASVHLFKRWVLSFLIASFLASLCHLRASLASRFRAGWARISSQWDLATALAFEGIFLVGLFLWVAASAPESRSDAVTRYWPYVKLVKHHSGFFDLPYQWWFVLPQAGLTYAASVFLPLGAQAVRWSMLLA
jgi:hypothetical protein